MDKPDKIWATGKQGFPSRWNDHPEKGYHSHTEYLLATPERELASELVEALREICETPMSPTINDFPGFSDAEIAQLHARDMATIARAVLAKLEGKG